MTFPWSNQEIRILPMRCQYFVFSFVLEIVGYSFSSTLGILSDLGGNSVHISNTFLGKTFSEDGSITIKSDLSNESSWFQLLKRVSDVLAWGESWSLSSSSSSLFASIVLSEGVDSNLSSHVELVSNRGGSDVKPVLIVRCEILETSGFIVDGPLYYII